MNLIILFALVNIVIASILERKKLKLATTAHAILFCFLFFCMLFTSDTSWMMRALQTVIPRNVFATLQAVFEMVRTANVMLPVLAFEVVFILESAISALYITWKTTKHIISKLERFKKAIPLRKTRRIVPERIGQDIRTPKTKICYLYCSMLC